MARFTHSLAQTFLRSRGRPEPSVVTMLPAVEAPLDDADERQRGPGWFDSSWDLQRGLEVREGLPGDPQLNEWIEVCLRGAPAPAVAALTPVPSTMQRPALAMPRGPAAADRPCDWALV